MSGHFLRHTTYITIQVIILAFGYGFLGAVLYHRYLYPSDRVIDLWEQHLKVVTFVASLIATALAVSTATLFAISIKEALRHRMSNPISLVLLSAGVALSKGSYMLSRRHWKLTTLTLFVYGVLRLLTAGWTNILTPDYLQMPIPMRGYELDITGTAFSTMLLNEYKNQGYANIRDDAFEVLDIGGMLSGISAAGQTYGLPGIFNFNGAKYNVSTQGIVPAIEEYSGSDAVPGSNGTRLGFSGGNVTVNTTPIPGKRTILPLPSGILRSHSMLQQGLTANVNCRPIYSNDTQYAWNTSNSEVVYANAAAPNTSLAGLRLWNIVGNCSTNTSMMQEYVTMVDAFGNASSSSGFLPSVVCPGPVNMSQTSTNLSQTHTSFTIISQGFNKYSFLNASVCEVTPLLTTVRANYSNDLISSEVLSSIPFRSENVQLLSFIAGVVKFQSISSQGLMSSTIGDTLYSIYSSTTTTTIGDNLGNQKQVYEELEDYWRGVVEFSATYLRSGFMAVGSFTDNNIPVELQSQVNGTLQIWIIGWTSQSTTYLLAIIPGTIITILTFACGLYSILQNGGYSTTFDASNTLHLIMAFVAGGLTLEDFGEDGIIANEGVNVKLEENGVDHRAKKFVKVD
ncbi:hypothetical protein BDR07DRAFT_1493739 [Suillus spraguei]|nr:hypothetical protein BDR07DRAFT_1493739 [Suillus spraguei]